MSISWTDRGVWLSMWNNQSPFIKVRLKSNLSYRIRSRIKLFFKFRQWEIINWCRLALLLVQTETFKEDFLYRQTLITIESLWRVWAKVLVVFTNLNYYKIYASWPNNFLFYRILLYFKVYKLQVINVTLQPNH